VAAGLAVETPVGFEPPVGFSNFQKQIGWAQTRMEITTTTRANLGVFVKKDGIWGKTHFRGSIATPSPEVINHI
jgi:hypothetical protein